MSTSVTSCPHIKRLSNNKLVLLCWQPKQSCSWIISEIPVWVMRTHKDSLTGPPGVPKPQEVCLMDQVMEGVFVCLFKEICLFSLHWLKRFTEWWPPASSYFWWLLWLFSRQSLSDKWPLLKENRQNFQGIRALFCQNIPWIYICKWFSFPPIWCFSL